MMPKISTSTFNWLVYVAAMAAAMMFLAWGKPFKIYGMFIAAGLAIGSLYALGGIGLVVLFRATGVLNFASGAAGAVGAMFAWQCVQWGIWPPVTWIVGISAALALTLAYGRWISPMLAHRDTVVKAVATLGYALILLGLVSFAWADDPRALELPTDAVKLSLMGFSFTGTRFLALAACVLITVGIWQFLDRTEVGLKLRAVANDRDLSGLLGIPILKVETVAWTMAGLIAGFTGLMFANLVRLQPAVITFMIIPSVAAALAGRLNNTALVLVAGLSMGVIENMMTLSPTFKSVRPIAPFVIAALVLLYHQRGLRLTFQERG